MSTLVVIAEHDQSVPDCMVDALEYNGYRVAAFEESAEATPFIRSHADSVGLVIVGSQARKHLSGIELLRASKSD